MLQILNMYIVQVQEIMDKFEAQAENMDVHSSVMEQGMGASSTLSTPADQVFEQILPFP